MSFDDSDDPLVAREDVDDPLDAALLDAERRLEPGARAGLDESGEPPVAAPVAVARQGNGQDPGRSHDAGLVTLYPHDIGRAGLLPSQGARELIASLRATRADFL